MCRYSHFASFACTTEFALLCANMHFCTILSACLLQNCKLFFVRFTSPLTLDCICRGRPLWVSFSLCRYPGASSASSLQCWLLLFKILCLSSLTFGFLKIYFFNQYFIPFTLFHEYSRNLYFFYWSNWPAAVVLPELRKSLQKLCVSVATPFSMFREDRWGSLPNHQTWQLQFRSSSGMLPA